MARARLAGLLATTALALSAASSPSYRVKLDTLAVPASGPIGMLVRARVNGGPVLRLLLDSGTQFVVLDRRAAGRSACSGGSDIDLVEPGEPLARPVKRIGSNTLEAGEVTLRDVAILVTNGKLADGIDGVIPLSVFAGFRIRLDVPGRTLDLLPYGGDEGDSSGAVPVVSSNELLFLKGTFNDTHEGYFLLDTGASYNAISLRLSRELNRASRAQEVSLRNGSAGLDSLLFADQARLRFGAREIAANPVVAIDLSTASRYHSLEVSGLIGYPALRRSVVTVNYRDSLVQIDPR